MSRSPFRSFHLAGQRRLRRLVALAGLSTALVAAAAPQVGVRQLPAVAPDGPIAIFYPTDADEATVQRGSFALRLAVDAPPVGGNRRLVVLSHGSGGSPWVHADLARVLVHEGFVVAAPWHRGDSSLEDGRSGPDSWAMRPGELSRAIDAVGRDARLAPLLDLDRVGIYGMSAGGHAALSMAGGRWSRAGFKRHCDAHLRDDFHACVGLATQLRGNALDGLKIAVARAVLDWVFDDDTVQVHHDPRVAAVAAAVPFAADFDLASLAAPRMPLALLTSGRDAWLVPSFHADRVLAACGSCVRLVDLPTGGHGAWLSPPPPPLDGIVGTLLNDPPGFDRSVLVAVDRRIAAFFVQHLTQPTDPRLARSGDPGRGEAPACPPARAAYSDGSCSR